MLNRKAESLDTLRRQGDVNVNGRQAHSTNTEFLAKDSGSGSEHASEVSPDDSIEPAVLTSKVINGVKKMLIFAGHQRSCHSIVGSIIDAHPHVILAPMFNPFVEYSHSLEDLPTKEKLFKKFYQAAKRSTKTFRSKDPKGYSLAIEGLFQGTFKDKVDVIGSIGANSRPYSHDPKQFRTLFTKMREEIGIPVDVIRVIRNPYDIIATAALYHEYNVSAVVDFKKQQSKGKLWNRVKVSEQLEKFSQWYFKLLRGTEGIIHLVDDHIDVLCEGLIANPKGTIRKVCDFLQLKCSEDYVTKCAAKVFPSTSTTRKIVEWPSYVLDYIKTSAKDFPYLKEYINEGV